jgi:uncharacterized protein (TIGR03118 family)
LGAISAGIKFTVTDQVADRPGFAPIRDKKLVNPWGLSQGPATFLWVSDNGTNMSTIYNSISFAKAPLRVNVPGAPTGTTYINLPGDFQVSEAGKVGSSVFAFAGEGGLIQGWSPAVDFNNVVTAVNETAQGAVFKGLTLGMNGADPQLFAADFAQQKVEVFNSNFHKTGSFTDPLMTQMSYSPFNVQTLNGKLYVSYALHTKGSLDETAGVGLGAVDVFNMDGTLDRHLAIGGTLNAPWGMVIAPASFGNFAGKLLVGNFGDGKINVFDPNTGAFMGQLKDDAGGLIKIDGLWALHSGANGTITFSAGSDDEHHGLLGSISAPAAAAAAARFGADEVATMAEMHH